jgi:hypothetical protein
VSESEAGPPNGSEPGRSPFHPRAKKPVLDQLERTGIVKTLGPDHVQPTVRAAVVVSSKFPGFNS